MSAEEITELEITRKSGQSQIFLTDVRVQSCVKFEPKEDIEELEYDTNKECNDQIECTSFSEHVEVNEGKDQSILLSQDQDIGPVEIIQSEDKPKMLIQRVFHQAAKNVVEQQLEYVIADSEQELTKLVFGGLFNNKYYAYSPENYCKKHPSNLFEYKDEDLPKIGDKFESLETFRLYIDGNAKKWKYYLKCADSHRKQGKDTFVFKCVFARPRSKMSKAKGLRKRTRKVPIGDCPCRVFLKPLVGTKELTVVYVCNHHDHPLNDNFFNQLQHGRRLHPDIKEEIMDLLSLDVDREVIMKHFETLTGFSMSYGYFSNLKIYMKKHKIARQFSLEQLKEMYKKIERIKCELGLSYEKENEDNPDSLLESDTNQTGTSSQLDEVFNVLNAVSSQKKKKRNKPQYPEESINQEIQYHKPKKRKKEDSHTNYSETGHNQSRLETRLQELTHDRETLQSIKHLQDSVRCETKRNPWVEQDSFEPWNRTSTPAPRPNQQSYPLKQLPINEQIQELVEETVAETPQEVIETSLCTDGFEQNQDLFYENEVTVMETTNDIEYTIYQNETEISNSEVNTTEYVEPVDSNIGYCIQYENGEPANESYIFIENLDNVPVQVHATELAKVNILPKTQENVDQYVVDDAKESNKNDIVKTEDLQQGSNDQELQIEIREEMPSENLIYEVIETNNKKIFPSRDIVNSVILNKKPKDTPKEKSTKKIKFRKTSSNTHGRNNKQQRNIPDIDDEKYNLSDYIKEESFDCVLDDLEDDDHVLILVQDEDVANKSTNFEFDTNINDKSIQCNINSSKKISEIEDIIFDLKRKKRCLKEDVEYLQDTRKRLLKEITQTKRNLFY